MIGTIFGEPDVPSEVPIFPGEVETDPMVVLDPSANIIPLDVSLDKETPVGGPLASVDPVSKTFIQEGSTVEVSPLLKPEESDHLHRRWLEIQGTFVDDPRFAVKQADALVSEVVEKIIQVFSSEHSALEVQWNQGKDLSTEDLRKSLQHYRSFFNRLVD